MDDPSLYVIDQKLVPRVGGVIPDRINPYEDCNGADLGQAWTKYNL